jgi:hypothetical protein
MRFAERIHSVTMTRIFLSALTSLVLVAACSSSSPSGSDAPDSGGGACPDASGTWTITQHCDTSLVGEKVVVTQTDCSLSFAAPFDGFAGTLTTGGGITLTGAQSCSGTVSGSTITMVCTPGTCDVALTR